MPYTETMKKRLITALKLNGFIIRSELATFIYEYLNSTDIKLWDNFDHYVKLICDYLEKNAEHGKCIEKENIEKALKAITQVGVDENETMFRVIDCFNYPILGYDIPRKHYFIDTQTKPKIVASGMKKSEMFRHRYRSVKQRSERSFKQKNVNLEENHQFSLNSVDSLLTATQKLLERNFILGCLFLKGDGTYFIEDLTGMVELNLKHTKYHLGFYFENVFVLVNGHYSDRVLKVSTMMLPPAEEYKESKIMFTHLNYFGGPSELLARESIKLNEVLHENSENMIIFISDLWVDEVTVLMKLEKLFSGFDDLPPVAFIFMGNFLSKRYAEEALRVLTKGFRNLAEIIKKFDKLVKYSQMVFIPGMEDPCMPHILPRIPLPKFLSKEFQTTIPNSIFTTNPCRIQYCTKEIVIYRNNLFEKFMRDTLHKPHNHNLNEFIARTILSQAHLAPFSLHSQPVHWNFDYTLHLYPLPNLIVVGDKHLPYSAEHKGCTLMNPGSFSASGYLFKTYIPASDTLEDCKL